MIRHLYNLQSDHLGESNTPPSIVHRYYDIIDYIPCAVLYILMTVTQCFFLLPLLFFLREKGEGREIERDRNIDVIEKH